MSTGNWFMFHHEYPHPAVTVDVAVLRHHNDRLEILLIRRAQSPFEGHWALPGGFVGIDESLEAAARRELAEETGLIDLTLEQLQTFGDPARDPRERVITVVYLTVLTGLDPEIRAASDVSEISWFDVATLPELAFDHAEIIAATLRHAKATRDGG